MKSNTICTKILFLFVHIFLKKVLTCGFVYAIMNTEVKENTKTNKLTEVTKMASITREQINKLNSKCENGFSFDIQYFCFHNEKTFQKYIPTSENKFLRVSVMFYEKWNRFNKQTENTPTIHFAEYTKGNTEGVLVSHGLGYFVNAGEAVNRKNTKILQELTKNLNDEYCLKLFEEQKTTKINQLA